MTPDVTVKKPKAKGLNLLIAAFWIYAALTELSQPDFVAIPLGAHSHGLAYAMLALGAIPFAPWVKPVRFQPAFIAVCFILMLAFGLLSTLP